MVNSFPHPPHADLKYRVRESARAKHVSIKVSWLGEVEVVVPLGFDCDHVPDILRRQQAWIAKTTQRIKTERQSVPATLVTVLPEQIVLRSLAQEWRVEYCQTSSLQLRTNAASQLLLQVSGPIRQTAACRQLLLRWLSQMARTHLTPQLRHLSRELELPCNKIAVRGQKTRWASCSSHQNINLNYKLLFLPFPLVRYVMIHELCHTVHLDHSRQFWGLVGEKCPDYKRLDSDLRRAWRYVPEWVEREIEGS